MPFKKLWTFIRSYKMREMARGNARGPAAPDLLPSVMQKNDTNYTEKKDNIQK